ncbi:hypothetical protein JKP88DRAFT_347591 [Tribonema minus]|uniref:Kinesin light chain n=1 Tax=Tribonema minus TaxID=303371 RepID=A0A835ZDP0_9STRA|nr:hypothetical protein JKP88DRAFT_347591 [Tribonema minus]
MPVDEGALTSRQEEALELYGSAHKARLALLGEKHPDTVAVRNNIAELLERMGRADESLAMRERILQSLGVSQKDLAEMENVDEKAFNEQKMKTDEKWDEIQAEMIAEQRKQRQKVIKPDPTKLFSTKPKQTSRNAPALDTRIAQTPLNASGSPVVDADEFVAISFSAEESSCSGGQEDDDDDWEAYADEICRKPPPPTG